MHNVGKFDKANRDQSDVENKDNDCTNEACLPPPFFSRGVLCRLTPPLTKVRISIYQMFRNGRANTILCNYILYK